jgi:hypothetical protein
MNIEMKKKKEKDIEIDREKVREKESKIKDSNPREISTKKLLINISSTIK